MAALGWTLGRLCFNVFANFLCRDNLDIGSLVRLLVLKIEPRTREENFTLRSHDIMLSSRIKTFSIAYPSIFVYLGPIKSERKVVFGSDLNY